MHFSRVLVGLAGLLPLIHALAIPVSEAVVDKRVIDSGILIPLRANSYNSDIIEEDASHEKRVIDSGIMIPLRANSYNSDIIEEEGSTVDKRVIDSGILIPLRANSYNSDIIEEGSVE
ncbi:hypothetical protein MMC10_008885 [Thelotrema lepadinum]|nr:hypothetical protein [Thelotrema lepadinum]